MSEQPSLWTQNEWLGLLKPLVAPSPPLASPDGPDPADLTPVKTGREVLSMPTEATPAASPQPIIQSPESPPMAGNPERLLIIDTETTGLSADTHECIEVGAVLFHVPSRSVLSQISFLLPCSDNAAEAINGIPAVVTRLAHPWQASLICFMEMVDAADALVAHNVNFDRQWFGRGALPPLEKTWICSMQDIHWPSDRQLRPNPSVRDLALAYGVPVWAAHRALTDCAYLAQVFERCPELEQLLQAACEPRHLYRAQISYADRHLAKQAGFRWNEPLKGAWTRRLSQREVNHLSFAVFPVEEGET